MVVLVHVTSFTIVALFKLIKVIRLVPPLTINPLSTGGILRTADCNMAIVLIDPIETRKCTSLYVTSVAKSLASVPYEGFAGKVKNNLSLHQ